MRKIPNSLIIMQHNQREHTISIVSTAVLELQSEGYPITIKHLCERTGLSRSVFSKPHVKAVLDEVKPSCLLRKVASDGKLESQYAEALLQLEKSKRRESDLKSANIGLRENVQELRSECELLRGKLHSLMRQNAMCFYEGGGKK